jgi:hypothetical protein
MKEFSIFALIASVLAGFVIAIIKVPAFGIVGFIAGFQYAIVIAGITWLLSGILRRVSKTDLRILRLWIYRGAIIIEIVGLGLYIILK